MNTNGFVRLPEEYVAKKFAEIGYKAEYQQSSGTWVCSCPICMEGKSYGKKKRCFYIPSKELIYCHNCGWSSRPLKWILTAGGLTYKDVMAELGTTLNSLRVVNLDIEEAPDEKTKAVAPQEECDLPQDSINLFDPIQVEFYKNKLAVKKALEYLKNRRLDTAVNAPSGFFVSVSHPIHRNRLIIPFFDIAGRVAFYQSRAIGVNPNDEMEKVRYLGKKNSIRTVFNINKVDQNLEHLFVFEGPLDACFVKNGVAVAGINTSAKSDFTIEQRTQLSFFSDKKIVWCLDSQWLDEASRVKSGILLKNGECVFVWPEKIGKKYKDFNDLCIAEGKDEVPIDFILSNTLCGEVGLLKYRSLWL